MQGADVPLIYMDESAAGGYRPAPSRAQDRGQDPPPARRKPRLPPGSKGIVAVLSVTIVILLIAAAILANAVFGTRMVSALLSVGQNDVFLRDPRPHGDNLSAIVPVEIEIMNEGDGRSGNISVWCGAFSTEQSNLLKADFNTTQLVKVGDPRPVTKISERQKPGSIVRARGELRLPPGAYDVRLRIYEDAGKRTLVSGTIGIIVNQTMVNIDTPYKPQGRSPGRSYPEKAPAAANAGSMPGFDAPVFLGAGMAAVAVAWSRKGPLRKFNMRMDTF